MARTSPKAVELLTGSIALNTMCLVEPAKIRCNSAFLLEDQWPVYNLIDSTSHNPRIYILSEEDTLYGI